MSALRTNMGFLPACPVGRRIPAYNLTRTNPFFPSELELYSKSVAAWKVKRTNFDKRHLLNYSPEKQTQFIFIFRSHAARNGITVSLRSMTWSVF